MKVQTEGHRAGCEGQESPQKEGADMSPSLIGEASKILNGRLLVDNHVNLCSGDLDTQLDHKALDSRADLSNMRSVATLPKH